MLVGWLKTRKVGKHPQRGSYFVRSFVRLSVRLLVRLFERNCSSDRLFSTVSDAVSDLICLFISHMVCMVVDLLYLRGTVRLDTSEELVDLALLAEHENRCRIIMIGPYCLVPRGNITFEVAMVRR